MAMCGNLVHISPFITIIEKVWINFTVLLQFMLVPDNLDIVFQLFEKEFRCHILYYVIEIEITMRLQKLIALRQLHVIEICSAPTTPKNAANTPTYLHFRFLLFIILM